MTLPEIQPSSNGRHQAPPEKGGAFALHSRLEEPAHIVQRQKRTQFPADLPARSPRALLYSAYHHEFGGTRLTRWLLIVLIALGIGWALFLPVRWLGPAIAAMAGITLIGAIVRVRRDDFVSFEEQPLLDVVPARLVPGDKIAVYATGNFSVEGKHHRFTALPGFVRTFATGEHAVLCLARERRFAGIGRWPALETGMWYIFFQPHEIHSVRYGTLTFNPEPTPAIAVDYQLTIPADNGSDRVKISDETVYLVCEESQDIPTLLADMRFNLPRQADRSD